MTKAEFIRQAQELGYDKNEAKARFEELDAQGAFDDSVTPVEMMEPPAPEVAAQERFDELRPRMADGIFGEDAGRSIDAGMLGVGKQLSSLGRGVQNLNPFQTDEQEAALDEEAAFEEQLAEQTYGTSNPIASGAGALAPSLASMPLSGGLLAQMAFGALEAGLEHTSDDHAGIDAGVGAAATGVFGKGFDLVGRAFSNNFDNVVSLMRGERPSVGGADRDMTQRAVDFADEEGIELLPSQRTGRYDMSQTEARMAAQPSGAAINDIRQQQQEKINSVIMQRFGIDNALDYSDTVAQRVDSKITEAFNSVKKDIPTTNGDGEFLDQAAEIATRATLTKEQVNMLEEIALDVASGMPAQKLLDTRKQLQDAVVGNFTKGDSVYAQAQRDLVDSIDDLVERSAGEDVAMLYRDARDMSRIRMALEWGSSVSPRGEINPSSFHRAIRKIYQNEFGRGRGHDNPATERVFDAARAGSIFADKVGNSGTATRSMQDWRENLSDKFFRKPMVNFYLDNPYLYGTFDPMSQAAQSAAYRTGRLTSSDGEDLEGLLGGVMN